MPTAERVRAGVVPSPADGFTARPESASAVEPALVPGGAVALVPAQRPAGGPGDWPGTCGKTQVAVSCAEWLWHSGKVDLLIWVAATSRAAILSGYVEAAVAATGADPADDAETVAGRFLGWLTETSRPWLVVLDDLSDAADLDGLRPEGPAGRVLITTRNPTAVPRDRALGLPLGAFSPREALSYLMGRLIADPDQRLGAIDLIQGLGCEPLALAHASGVIASSALSCRDYLDYFLRRREYMAQAAGGEPAAAAVTWTFAAEQAERLSPRSAQSLLAMAALLDGNGIPAAVFATPAAREYLAEGTQPANGEPGQAALSVLERVGLLATGSAGTPVVRVNPVIQAAVRTAAPADMLDRAARAAADALLAAWPGDEPGAWSAEAFRACAASLRRTAGDVLWQGGCHPLLLRAGQSLDQARLAGPAVSYWQELAAVGERVLGPDDADTRAAGHRLAHACLAAGRSAEAVSWFQWALADRARALGDNHPRTIAARLDLGRALVAANQFSDAITALSAAVGDYEHICGNDHLDTLGARDELASAHYAAGQYGEAAELYRRTLADRERVEGAQHPGTLATRQKLADAYLAAGQLKNALSQYKRVLSERETVLGPDHPDTIAARAGLGSAYHSGGRMASALQFYEQACAGYEKALGPDHPDTLAGRANLGLAYAAVGRLTDGLAVLRDTAARCEQSLPPGDPLTQAVQESLANIAGG